MESLSGSRASRGSNEIILIPVEAHDPLIEQEVTCELKRIKLRENVEGSEQIEITFWVTSNLKTPSLLFISCHFLNSSIENIRTHPNLLSPLLGK